MIATTEECPPKDSASKYYGFEYTFYIFHSIGNVHPVESGCGCTERQAYAAFVPIELWNYNRKQ